MNAMNRHQQRLALMIVIAFVLLVLLFIPYLPVGGNVIQTPQTTNTTDSVKVTSENLPRYLEQQEIIQNLPTSSVISLRLYNFNTGERQWEEVYTLTRGNVSLGITQSSDMDIIVHSKYEREYSLSVATVHYAVASLGSSIGHDCLIFMQKLLRLSSLLNY